MSKLTYLVCILSMVVVGASLPLAGAHNPEGTEYDVYQCTFISRLDITIEYMAPCLYANEPTACIYYDGREFANSDPGIICLHADSDGNVYFCQGTVDTYYTNQYAWVYHCADYTSGPLQEVEDLIGEGVPIGTCAPAQGVCISDPDQPPPQATELDCYVVDWSYANSNAAPFYFCYYTVDQGGDEGACVGYRQPSTSGSGASGSDVCLLVNVGVGLPLVCAVTYNNSEVDGPRQHEVRRDCI